MQRIGKANSGSRVQGNLAEGAAPPARTTVGPCISQLVMASNFNHKKKEKERERERARERKRGREREKEISHGSPQSSPALASHAVSASLHSKGPPPKDLNPRPPIPRPLHPPCVHKLVAHKGCPVIPGDVEQFPVSAYVGSSKNLKDLKER